jgi:2-keto-4-pentenoate hydratase
VKTVGLNNAIRVHRLAELLMWSRKTHERLQGLPEDLSPANLDQAYEIQTAVTVLRAVPLAGFKIGLTNQAAQRANGAAEPIVGRLGLMDIRRTHSRIELPANHLRIIESEVIFEVGADLAPERAPFTEQRVAGSLRRAFAGFELCNARIADREDTPLTHVVADNSNADLVIVGDPLESWDAATLANLPVTLEVRGNPPVKGSTANVLGQPLRAVTWLANWLARHGAGLQKGQLVASGSCTGMTPIPADGQVVARFGERAQVQVEFIPDGK